MTDIAIQPHTEADRNDVVAGIIDLQEVERAMADTRMPGIEVADAYVEQLLKWIRERSGKIFVAKDKNRFVGFVACGIEHHETVAETLDSNTYGYIVDAYVVPESRGKGVFKMLNAKAEEFLIQSDVVKLIRITVLAKNDAALRAYERVEYVPEEIILMKRVKK